LIAPHAHIFSSLYFSASRDPSPLLSFPTRRSSDLHVDSGETREVRHRKMSRGAAARGGVIELSRIRFGVVKANPGKLNYTTAGRSEEHTSELQSRSDLVCRLLLEKKKQNTTRCNRT